MPCKAEAITSGLRTQSPNWRRVSQGKVMHMALEFRTDSASTLGPKELWPSILKEKEKFERKRENGQEAFYCLISE